MLDRGSGLLFELWLKAGAIKGLIVIAACFIHFVSITVKVVHGARAHLQVPVIPLPGKS